MTGVGRQAQGDRRRATVVGRLARGRRAQVAGLRQGGTEWMARVTLCKADGAGRPTQGNGRGAAAPRQWVQGNQCGVACAGNQRERKGRWRLARDGAAQGGWRVVTSARQRAQAAYVGRLVRGRRVRMASAAHGAWGRPERVGERKVEGAGCRAANGGWRA